jgi:major cell surface glycoprotein (TIGR04216 family)
MSGYQSDKIRAVVLSALMVLSVMVGSIAFAGTAAAAPNDLRAANDDAQRTGEFNTADGEGVVFPGAVVYQGEDDIEFGGPLSGSLTGVSGNAEGQVLSPPIPQDQTVGVYSNDGTSGTASVTVDQPRITTFDVNNQNGEDISGGSIGKVNANLTVVGEYNFNAAEDLEITVSEEGGLEVTDDVVTSSTTANSAGEVTYDVDLTDESAGTYTIELAGSDSLDFGSAAQSTTVEVTAQDNVGVDLGSDTATQGDNLRYEVTGSVAGNYHLVQISGSDFRPGQSLEDYGSIFRNVGDVSESGLITTDPNGDTVLHSGDAEIPTAQAAQNAGYEVQGAYAIVQIDDDTGLGVGSINTQYLDTVSTTVDVSDELVVDANGDVQDVDGNDYVFDNDANTGGAVGEEPFVAINGDESTDDTDFDVEEGTVSLESPGNTYVVGSEVDVNGTAPTGMDNVAIYARDEGGFELVEIDGELDLAVDADGTFEETDVTLSTGNQPGNDILSLPGSYRFGVIDASDADTDNDGSPDAELDTQEFNQGTSSQTSIRTIGTSLDAQFPSLIRGQISDDDGDVTVNGSAPGSSEVLFIAVGPRGNVFTQQISVDSDQTFDEEDIALGGINKGAVSLHVYSVGRDDRPGDGALPNDQNANLDDFEGFVNGLEGQSLTGDQVRSSILSETVEDSASDDQLVNQNARLVDTQSNIQNVYQEGNQASGINPVAVGETLIVEGQTNLQPDDNTVTVELGNEDTTVGLAATEEWGEDGQFSVEIDTTDAATGTYTLEVDDGQNTVTEEVELVEEVSTPTPTPTEADDTPTATDSPTPTATASPTPTEMPDTDTATPTPTEGGGPGFGAVVALVALLAAALLATRRDN